MVKSIRGYQSPNLYTFKEPTWINFSRINSKDLPWNRFVGSFKGYKFGLWARTCKPFKKPRNRLPVWQPYLTYLPARLHRKRNRFQGSISEPVFVDLSRSPKKRCPAWRNQFQESIPCSPFRCLSMSEAPPLVWPHSPPPLTHCIRVYLYSYSLREGGRVEPERRLEWHPFTKLGRKYRHDWLYLQSINLDKHLPQSPFTDQFFLWHFALEPIKLISQWLILFLILGVFSRGEMARRVLQPREAHCLRGWARTPQLCPRKEMIVCPFNITTTDSFSWPDSIHTKKTNGYTRELCIQIRMLLILPDPDILQGSGSFQQAKKVWKVLCREGFIFLPCNN